MDSVANILDRFPGLCRLRWTLRFARAFDAPLYLGSALRGLLGHGLRHSVCVTRLKTCSGCALVDSCVYTELFEPTSRTAGWARAPYVLSVPNTQGRHYSWDDVLIFEMSLLLPHERQLPYLVQGFKAGGRLGLGPNNTGFEVVDLAVLQTLGRGDWRSLYDGTELAGDATTVAIQVPPCPERVFLEWGTPWRLKRRGHFVGPGQFSTALLLESLLYRFFELVGERPPKQLLEKARDTAMDADGKLEWQDWARYSSRQKTRMQVGGLMGSITLSGGDLASWWPLLWLGQWLHLGKFTSMGLGRYRLSAASLPEQCR